MIEVSFADIGYINNEGHLKNKTAIFKNLELTIKKGSLYCVLGANGVGKTTLFRTILGFMPTLSGEILIDGRNINSLKRKELAGKISYVPQSHIPPFPYSVIDIVLMGRGAHLNEFSSPKEDDIKIAEDVLDKLGISHLKKKIYTKLSGGERQLVLIARAIAQETDYIFMDEPGANLDYGNQVKILKILRQLSENGKGVCFTTHSPEHALLCDADIIAIEDRNSIVSGKADEIVTENLLQKMYGINVVVREEKVGNECRKILIPVFEKD